MMKTNKILTVIIPTYNMENYLHRCMDSLIVSNENMQCLEVLVINDGSKDSSSRIAHEYENRYPHTIRVIDKENGNYGSCINRGVKEATGKYIKVLDADDYFNNKEFDNYISVLKNVNADLILSNYTIVDENGVTLSQKKYDLPNNQYLNRKEIDHLATFYNMQMHGITYSKRLFDDGKYKQTEGISYTDQEWIFTPMYKVNNVYVTNYNLYQYLIGREGQTMDSRVMVRNISHTVIGLYKMIKDYSEMSFEDESEKSYFKYRIILRMRYVYYNYIISNQRILDSSELYKIDQEIKKMNLEVYDWANDIPLVKFWFCFIYSWRRNPNSICLRILRIICIFFNLK